MPAPKGHKYSVGNNGGKPPIYKTPNALQKAVDEYFVYIQGEYKESPILSQKTGKPTTKTYTECVRPAEPPTVTGLALYLGFSSRQSLYDYAQKEKYSYIVEKAKTRVEHGYEVNLHSGSPTGAIFALKNMGWKDRVDTDLTSGGEPIQTGSDLGHLTLEELKELKYGKKTDSNS